MDSLTVEVARAKEALQTFFDRAPFGVHHYRLLAGDRLEFMEGNAAADRILGIKHAELVGKTIEEAFPSLADGPVPVAYRRVARDGGVFEDEQISYSDERIIGVYDVHAFQPATGEVAALFRDITERRRAEIALSEKTEELDGYFSLGLELLCIASADGQLRRVNTEWEKTLGWTAAELEGSSLIDIVHADDREQTLALLHTLAAEKGVHSLVNRCRCRDATYRTLEWRASVTGGRIYAVARDITERVLMQEAIAEREKKLESIFRAAPVGIGLIAARVITDANDRLCEMLGYTRSELIGSPSSILFFSAEEHDKVMEGIRVALDASGVGSVESLCRKRDGTPMDVILGTARLVPSDPDSAITFTLLDVSERKRAEAERQSLESRMLQTQKLESLGVLAGGIAHDFNNILMAVLGHADLAQTRLPPSSAVLENITEIEKAARQAAGLCRQMLAYSGKGKFQVAPLNVSEVIAEMEHMLEVSVSKKAALQLLLAPGLPSIEADAAQIRQVVMNLVINASEAIGDSAGLITVATGSLTCDRQYLRSISLDDDLAEGRYVFFEVTDNGRGMSPATQARIFEPFFTTKFTGRGLGLAAVLGIMRGHKGAIKVYSEEGRGTTFKALFPATAATSVTPAPPSSGTNVWQGTGLVLLADDEEAVRTVCTDMLKVLGFDVICAQDGREATEVFAKHRDRIVCVIMDLTMPKMDGEEAFREIRRIKPDVRVLLSSGYNEQEAVQRFVGRGIAGFLQKPYQLSVLAQKLREILGGRGQEARPAPQGPPNGDY